MKCGREAALAGNEVRPAFEKLRRQTGGHASRLTGEGTSHIKPASGIAARDDLDRADCLRPSLLRGVECLLRAGGARPDLRNIKVAREPLLFRSEEHTSELQSRFDL